jgi:hypothetical protein
MTAAQYLKTALAGLALWLFFGAALWIFWN